MRANRRSVLRFDTHELDALAISLPRLGVKGAKIVGDELVKGGAELRELWRKNAEFTAGKHGRLYPKSIESNLVLSTDIVVEVGPNPNKPQGGMSFENGSVNQPAHNDGKKAATLVLPLIEKAIAARVGRLEL